MDSYTSPTITEITQMIEVSAVQADSSDETIADAVACAERYQCYLVTTLPSQARRTRELLADLPTIRLGGNVGFPSGGQTTHIKSLETRELVEVGVDEVDMVIDIAAHLSGRHKHVHQDVAAVVEAAQGRPVKVILECHYLSDDHIRLACDIAIEAGADFVKTGTGWAPTGATLHNIAVMKDHVGEEIAIKASGGIRDLEMIQKMHGLGVHRFGISAQHVPAVVSALERSARRRS